MKVRIGFVSNSSSSSFCIYKKIMSGKQIEEFKNLLEIENHQNGDETYIEEDGNYFIGNLDQNNENVLRYMNKNFMRDDYGISYR
jgi:hypothetical protein